MPTGRTLIVTNDFPPRTGGIESFVLALCEPQQPTRAALAQRAETIQTRWGLPASKWLRVFHPAA